MKHILYFLIAVMLGLLISGCSDEPPSVRVYNQHSEKANVQIKTPNGNTINHNDIDPGTMTPYKDIAEGICTASAVIQKDTAEPVITFKATNDHAYTIVLVQSNPSYLRVDTKSR